MRVFVSIDGPVFDVKRFEECNQLYSSNYAVIANTLLSWQPVTDSVTSLELISSSGHEAWLVIPCFYSSGLVDLIKAWCQHFFPTYMTRVICTPDFGVIGQPGDVLVSRQQQDRFPGVTLEFSTNFGWPACIRFIQAFGTPAPVKRGNIQDHVRTQVGRVERGEIGLQEFFDEIKRGADLREIIARLVKP